MWRTNVNVVLTVVGTLVAYTLLANMIPQVESAVPEAVELSADVTPEELVEIGAELYAGAGGCTVCHGLGTRAPDVLGVVGTVCGTRKPDLSCKQYLFESLMDPGTYVVEGFQPIMPSIGRMLSQSQIWALVAFLQSQGGEVTVSSEDLASADATTGGDPGEAAPEGEETAESDPRALIEQFACLACHQLEGEGAAIGPPFEAMADKELDYLRRGIVDPNADTAEGYEAFAGTMPPNFGELMTEAQIEALVRFLEGR